VGEGYTKAIRKPEPISVTARGNRDAAVRSGLRFGVRCILFPRGAVRGSPCAVHLMHPVRTEPHPGPHSRDLIPDLTNDFFSLNNRAHVVRGAQPILDTIGTQSFLLFFSTWHCSARVQIHRRGLKEVA
jgi:hypothetical protein